MDNRGIVPRIEYGKVGQRMQTAQRNIGQVHSSAGPLQCCLLTVMVMLLQVLDQWFCPASAKGAVRSWEALRNVGYKPSKACWKKPPHRQLPPFGLQVHEILMSTWPAATEPDPEGGSFLNAAPWLI